MVGQTWSARLEFEKRMDLKVLWALKNGKVFNVQVQKEKEGILRIY